MRFTKVCGKDVVLPDPKNSREVFAYVANFLLNQKERCVNPNSEYCTYRSIDGLNACAVGCLIPDSDYSKNFENGTVISNAILYDYLVKAGYDVNLLYKLQNIHDSSAINNRYNNLIDLYNNGIE